MQVDIQYLDPLWEYAHQGFTSPNSTPWQGRRRQGPGRFGGWGWGASGSSVWGQSPMIIFPDWIWGTGCRCIVYVYIYIYVHIYSPAHIAYHIDSLIYNTD